MKRIIAGCSTFLLILSLFVVPSFGATPADMRAVWISTVYNIDYPTVKSDIEAQKKEFIDKLDQIQDMGMNTVIVQVRPKADAFYRSKINPWSDILTGTQGKDPGYDPMAFMIEEAHKRNMEFHAWLNPYRVTTTGTDLTALSSTHPARLNPGWTIMSNNALYYNPEIEGVKAHIVDTVKEIAENYDLDGIHFDDYFYPSSYALPVGESRDGQVANNRRANVNDMIARVSETIKSVNKAKGKNIAFGVSPAGIWKNSTSDPTGSNTNGNESYYSVYADTRTWIQNGWLDYVAPQIYWETGHKLADYETLVKWWSNEVKDTQVKLYIGQGVYRDVVATQIDVQLGINQKYDVKGSIYFSLRDLLNNRMNCKDKVTAFYKNNPVVGTGGGASPSPTPGNGNNAENNGGTEVAPKPTPTPSVENKVDVNAVGKVGTVMADTLNIRAGARTDRDVVAKVTKGTKLTIKSILNDWYKVQLTDGTVGWANANYIKVEQSTSSESTTQKVPVPTQKGTVTATTLNVRSASTTTSNIVGKLAKGDAVAIYFVQGDWCKVKLTNGVVGWVSKQYIKM